MAARYATCCINYHDTVLNKDMFVEADALRDSTAQVVIQYPSLFQNTPLTYGQLPPALVGYLLPHPSGNP
jgi:hypothetical protein